MRFYTINNDNITNFPYTSISTDEIDVWILQKKVISLDYQKLVNSLSEIESKHINAKELLISRWFLRKVLSVYTGTPPEKLIISYTETGKPFLHQEGKNKLYFNLSHSEDLLVCVVAFGKKIGIDIEINKPISNVDDIVSRFFSIKEQNYLFSLSKKERNEEFLWNWVSKEAYLKATGVGISAIESVEIFRRENELLIHDRDSDVKCENWQLISFVPYNGYFGCVVYYS